MARVRNAAGQASLVALFRGHLNFLQPTSFDLDLDELCRQHQALLGNLLRLTQRPSTMQLQRALENVFPEQGAAAGLVAGALATSVQQLRRKARNSTTGARMSAAVGPLVALLQVHAPKQPLGQALKQRARVLQRRASEEKAKQVQEQQQQAVAAPLSPAAIDRLYSGAAAAITVSSEEEGEAALEYWDASQFAQVRLYSDGKVEVASMSRGGQGFLMATWNDGSVSETEQANLALRKKPTAATSSTIEEQALGGQASVPEELEEVASSDDAEAEIAEPDEPEDAEALAAPPRKRIRSKSGEGAASGATDGVGPSSSSGPLPSRASRASSCTQQHQKQSLQLAPLCLPGPARRGSRQSRLRHRARCSRRRRTSRRTAVVHMYIFEVSCSPSGQA